ncbi:tetratricopeptide repeat protein [Marinobacter shengliensis]|uniref:tetratricopeptide repeat protein n=1 Tax=Marinobacter shengliensis TaxID=1389223 RepID=UPI000D106226|nr:tetratricopeptide repeat protein [Marinobacter shengliensis]PSF11248.1 hypothetical protein C7H10_16040 [Marinobacter shengliensis]
MKISNVVRVSLLSAAIALSLTGCNSEPDMSQDDIQYISHLDQARFFQRQGELRASTIEARSAIQMQPERIDPYFVIINNLLTAGDAVNAERQLDQFLENRSEDTLTQSQMNQAALIRAESRILQGKTAEAVQALDQISSPSRDQELKADNLRGQAWLSAGDFDRAEAAYNDALQRNDQNVTAAVGLSRIAAARGDIAKARELLSQAETIDSDHEDIWLWKAQLAHSQEQWAEAEQNYIRALETIGQYDVMTYRKYQTISALVTVLRQQGKSAEAFVYEEILAKSGPGTIKSNLEAAAAAYNDGDLDTAARFLQEVLNQAPGHQQSALMLGVIRFRQGRTEEAASLLEPLAEMNDTDGVRKLLAATRISMRDPQGAKTLLDDLKDRDSDPQTLALVGIASLASGDDQSGRQLINRALELQPDNHNLRLRYATYLAQREDYEAAISQARQIPAEAPESTQATILVSQAQMASGNPDAAHQALDDLLSKEPANVAALIAKGNLAGNTGNMDNARKFFEQAHKAAPDNPTPLVGLGNLARLRDDNDTARELYTQAVRLAPDNRGALQAIANLLPRDDLTELMRSIREDNPEAAGPRLILLETALIENNTSEADELTAQLMERQQADAPAPTEPLVATVYDGIATQMVQRGQTERALQILNRGRTLFPDNEDMALKVASIEFRNGNTAAARDALRDAKQHNPESPGPYQLEASYYESQGEHQQAAELYQLALTKRNTPELQVARARALSSAGQPTAALESLERALEQFPNNTRIMLSLAMAHQQTGQQDKAKASYEQLVSLSPTNAVALNNLAWLYYETGDNRALDTARKAYELVPDSAAVADTYGWILFESGEQQQSLVVLEKAHELDPGSREIAMHLVEAYRAAGRDDDARRILTKLDNEA